MTARDIVEVMPAISVSAVIKLESLQMTGSVRAHVVCLSCDSLQSSALEAKMESLHQTDYCQSVAGKHSSNKKEPDFCDCHIGGCRQVNVISRSSR